MGADGHNILCISELPAEEWGWLVKKREGP
jgi:hypothetical protein